MSREEFIEAYKNDPEIIEPSTIMNEPNVSIEIFDGEFILNDGIQDISVNGKIIFSWLPRYGAHFFGKASSSPTVLQSFSRLNSFEVLADGLRFGNAHITKIQYGNAKESSFIKGTFSRQCVWGDRSIPVEKLNFSIANLRDFNGLLVKRITDTKCSAFNNRLIFENDEYLITIDKYYDYEQRKEALEEKGGYLLLYNGEVRKKSGQIVYENLQNLFQCFTNFLSFLNGRRTSAIFIKGIFENETKWVDCSNYFVDIYKTVPSWSRKKSIDGLNEVWQNFYNLWKDGDNKSFFIAAIHWYVEANSHSGFSEGSIIMAQTALELLYNWWIVERKKLIIGKDSENINASNKIRLLLSQLNISHSVPDGFTNLAQFINENDIVDAPDAVVQIRNAIVHSQEEKRKKLGQIELMTKYEALQLCIWYIEMTLLKILEFDETYFNRCARTVYVTEAEEFVPWKKR